MTWLEAPWLEAVVGGAVGLQSSTDSLMSAAGVKSTTTVRAKHTMMTSETRSHTRRFAPFLTDSIELERTRVHAAFPALSGRGLGEGPGVCGASSKVDSTELRRRSCATRVGLSIAACGDDAAGLDSWASESESERASESDSGEPVG